MKKGKEKKEENYIKKGGKGLKNASFWAINSKNLFDGEKNGILRGGGEMIRMHNIYPSANIIIIIFHQFTTTYF